MISFRKHAPESTRRPDSLLRGRGPFAWGAPLLAAMLILSLGAPTAFPAPRQQPQKAKKARGLESPAESPQASAKAAQGQTEEAAAEEPMIPIRVTRVETPDGPGFVATIGEFPSDLKEAGQEFLKREFFEHFASDVLGLAGADARSTLKVSLLPQEKENQREGDFTSGKVSGHMVVLVERRRVFVACTFSEPVRKPSLLAAVERFSADALDAE